MTAELLDLATSVVAQAVAGEGLEVYAARGNDTEVRAYDGEVESLTSADSSGVGIRVVLEGAEGSRVGFAWAQSLDPSVLADTLADARDNARFATPDPDVVLATPDGLEAADLDLWDDGVAATAMEKKVALALDLERATRAADPRVRQVSSADYADSRVEVALASTTGIASSRGGPMPTSRSTRSPARAPRPRPAPASAWDEARANLARRGDGRRRRPRRAAPRRAEGPFRAPHRRLRPPGRLDPPRRGGVSPLRRGRGERSLLLRRPDR